MEESFFFIRAFIHVQMEQLRVDAKQIYEWKRIKIALKILQVFMRKEQRANEEKKLFSVNAM